MPDRSESERDAPASPLDTPQGDKPRKIVVCHPSEVFELQRSISREFTDVLVKPNRWVEPGNGYVLDASGGLFIDGIWDERELS